MSYEYKNTAQFKSRRNDPHTFADKTTVFEKIKDHAGKIYARMLDGSIRRLDPLKPWRGKSERRQIIKERRELPA